MDWRFAKHWLRLATIGGGKGVVIAKFIGLAVAILSPIGFQDTMYLSLFEVDNERMVAVNWHPEIGWFVTGTLVFLLVVATSAVAWITRTKAVFLPEKIDLGTWKGHYRIPIKNCTGATIKNCAVVWESSIPPSPHPQVHLHCSDETEETEKTGIMLAPYHERTFDVIRVDFPIEFEPTPPGAVQLVLMGPERTKFRNRTRWVIAGARNQHEIPIRKYEVTLLIKGDDLTPRTEQFII